jgi:hypothetical protein
LSKRAAHIIYADGDGGRTQKTTNALKAAGYTVFPCSGCIPAPLPDKFGHPDLVLLHVEIGESLKLLVETLWPHVPYRLVGDSEDIAALIAQISATLAPI